MSYTRRFVGRWRWRDNRFVFRRHIKKWLERNGGVQLLDSGIRWVWQLDTIAGRAYIMFPNRYREIYLVIVKFENPFKAVQVEPLVDYERKELIYTFPYIDTGQPYTAVRRFIKQFRKFLKHDEV